MQFSFCLILLSSIFVEYSLTINDTELIQCTSRCQRFTVPFSDALTFPADCQENNYEFGAACGIEYTLNYDTEQIDIDFHTSNDTGSLEDQKPSDFLVQTIRLSLSHNPAQPNIVIRKYACNSANDCAKKSYLDSINYLINQGKTQINKLKSKLQNDSLIVGPGSLRRCVDSRLTGNRPSVKCPNGLCYLRLDQFQLDEEKIQKVQNCQGYTSPSLKSEIEIHTPVSEQKARETLEYSCNKNVCNRNDILQRVRDLIREFTNANLNVENIVNEKKSNHSICQTISSMILVLFLFLFQLFI